MAAWHSAIYDLTSASISQALPSSPTTGDEVEVYVSAQDAGQTHVLTLTGTGGPFTVKLAGHGSVLRWTGSAWVERQDRKTLASLDGRYARYFATAIGDGSSTTITVTHNLNNRWVQSQIFDVSTGAKVEADVTNTTANALTVAFASAPASGAYELVVVG